MSLSLLEATRLPAAFCARPEVQRIFVDQLPRDHVVVQQSETVLDMLKG
jgi:hypothetical protein